MSDEFEMAFFDGSTCVGTCVCGRTHFSSGDAGFGDSDSDNILLEKAKAAPDRYIDHGSETVPLAYIHDQMFVIGCPCKALDKYEALFWSHKRRILQYFKARIDAEHAAISDLKALSDSIKEE